MKLNFKKINLNNFELADEVLDIWQFSLYPYCNAAMELLSAEEKTRALRFYFQNHREKFIMARAMLKIIIGQYLKISPNEIFFNYQKKGKPFLTHPSLIEFNLSHSESLALLAVGKQYPLGIDVEYYSARPYEEIGQQLFSEEENQQLNLAPNFLKPMIFFNIWSQKEAFIKTMGLGLSYPTQNFTVTSLPQGVYDIPDKLHQATWKILCFAPNIAASAGLCFHPTIKIINYHRVSFNDIFK